MRLVAVAMAIVMTVGGCSGSIGADGLPAHCDRKIDIARTSSQSGAAPTTSAAPAGVTAVPGSSTTAVGPEPGSGSGPEPTGAGPASFEQAVTTQLGTTLPKLRVGFSSGGRFPQSDSAGAVHIMSVTDGPNTSVASLRNDNGVELVRVSGVWNSGNWFVDTVEVCRSMQQRFGS